MENEKQFLRKPPSGEGDEQLFRDKLTPDTTFLNHLMFDGDRDISNWDDEGKAIQEINTLKAKKKELEHQYTELVNHLNNIYTPVYQLINEAIEKINPKVQEFAREHSEEITLEEHDGIKRGEMVLGEYKVERTETIKIKKASLKAVPNTGHDEDNEEIFSETTVKTEEVTAEQ